MSHVRAWGWIAVLGLALAARGEGVGDHGDFRGAPHRYFERTPSDRLTQLKEALESGALALDRSSEKAFLESLLGHLGVPRTSQMLVFSTTSLQLSRITPSNPRALYFSDDMYVGFIPGGKLEVIGLDPELGAIFHFFEIPSGDQPLRIERATRCMNCHAGEETGHVPGLLISSVVSGPNGGTLEAFRRNQLGHGVPLHERFGGWYLTGIGPWTNHWGNSMGRFENESLVRVPLEPESRVQFSRYLQPGSALLPQLVHEHQAGLVNRAVELGYRARTYLHAGNGELTPAQERILDEQSAALTAYLLFRDEVALPAGVDLREAGFERDFLARREAVDGRSLRDLDLRTRLFTHRCSFMIYSPVIRGLPPVAKNRVYTQLKLALADENRGTTGDHLPTEERAKIRAILRGTLKDLPGGW